MIGPTHGHALRPVDRLDPPDATRRWVSEASDGARVLAWHPLAGGTSSSVHRVTLQPTGPTSGHAQPTELVLRRYVEAPIGDDPARLVRHEATVLAHLATAADPDVLPAPRLVAADPEAARADVPALLMSVVPGRAVWWPEDPAVWIDQIVTLIEAIHTVVPPVDPSLPRYAAYRPHRAAPPPWTSEPAAWARALVLARAVPADPPPTFVHRDLHPGNLLWTGSRLTGVVDWASACVGPPSVDVAHSRANLLVAEPALAHRLRLAWEHRTGLVFDRWADLATVVGLLDGWRTQPPDAHIRPALDHLVVAAVAQIDG